MNLHTTSHSTPTSQCSTISQNFLSVKGVLPTQWQKWPRLKVMGYIICWMDTGGRILTRQLLLMYVVPRIQLKTSYKVLHRAKFSSDLGWWFYRACLHSNFRKSSRCKFYCPGSCNCCWTGQAFSSGQPENPRYFPRIWLLHSATDIWRYLSPPIHFAWSPRCCCNKNHTKHNTGDEKWLSSHN